MKRKKALKRVILSICILLSIGVLMTIKKRYVDNALVIKIPPQQISLFTQKAQRQVVKSETVQLQNNHSISSLFYGLRNRFENEIIIADFNVVDSFNMKRDIAYNTFLPDMDSASYYSFLTDFNFYYAEKIDTSFSKLKLSFTGTSFNKIILNDSIAYYSANLKCLALTDNKNGYPSIIIDTKNTKFQDNLFTFLFLKRHRELFLLILYNTQFEPYDVMLLYNLISK